MRHTSFRRAVPGIVVALGVAASFAQGAPAPVKKAFPELNVQPAKAAPLVVAAPVKRAAADFEFRTLPSDKTYRGALTRWLAEAPVTRKKWQLSWELAEEDYEFEYEGEFGPDLVRAVDGLCGALNASGVRARAYFYEGSHVVRIVMEGTPR